jgi:hypothetical protein
MPERQCAAQTETTAAQQVDHTHWQMYTIANPLGVTQHGRHKLKKLWRLQIVILCDDGKAKRECRQENSAA